MRIEPSANLVACRVELALFDGSRGRAARASLDHEAAARLGRQLLQDADRVRRERKRRERSRRARRGSSP